MSAQVEENVYAGRIDYRAGRGWITPDGTGKSMGDFKVAHQEYLESKED